MPCSVVCVSHATGSGGDEVGRLLAERLGFLHVDEEIVARAAARGGVSPADVANEERRKTLAKRILGSIAEGGSSTLAIGAGALPIVVGDERSSGEIQALIREAIEQTAARGNVVITAHAASHALEPAGASSASSSLRRREHAPCESASRVTSTSLPRRESSRRPTPGGATI